MKKLLKASLTVMMALTLSACGGSKDVNIGIVQYAEHPALDNAKKGFLKALEDNGYGEDNVAFDDQNAQGDGSNCTTIADKFVNDNVDLIFAIATPTAQAAANKTTEIPIVLSAVTDPASAKLVKTNEKPGGNVTGTSDLTPVADQFDLLQQLLPDAKTIGIMYCNAEDNSIFQADIAKEECAKRNLTVVDKSVTDSNQIQQVTESLIGKVDAIYIPTDNLLAEGMATVAQVANENNLPCIVGESGMVENGGLATYGIDYYNLGYRAGLQAIKILKGEAKPADMAIEYLPAEECELTINEKVAKKLNITIPDDLKSKAKMVNK